MKKIFKIISGNFISLPKKRILAYLFITIIMSTIVVNAQAVRRYSGNGYSGYASAILNANMSKQEFNSKNYLPEAQAAANQFASMFGYRNTLVNYVSLSKSDIFLVNSALNEDNLKPGEVYKVTWYYDTPANVVYIGILRMDTNDSYTYYAWCITLVY